MWEVWLVPGLLGCQRLPGAEDARCWWVGPGQEAVGCRAPMALGLVLTQWWAEPGSRIVIVGSTDLGLACWQEELAPDTAGCGFWGVLKLVLACW